MKLLFHIVTSIPKPYLHLILVADHNGLYIQIPVLFILVLLTSSIIRISDYYCAAYATQGDHT